MKPTVLEQLKKLQEAIDALTPEELVELVAKSGITEEQAKQYALLERLILERGKTPIE